MAKLDAPFEFNGSLSHLTFYKRRDLTQNLVKQKTGPSKEQIRHDPNFERTRKMGTEWQGCTLGTRWVRRILRPLEAVRDYNYVGQLSKLLKPVQVMDTESVYGQRSVGLSHYPRLLEGFSISRQTAFDSLLRTPLITEVKKQTLSGRVEIPAIIHGVNFTPRIPYPYFKVLVSLGVVPDLHYSPYGYTPVMPAGSYLPEVATTGWLGTKSGSPECVLELSLPYAVEFASYSLVLAVAVSFGTPDVLGNIQAVKYSGSGRIAVVA